MKTTFQKTLIAAAMAAASIGAIAGTPGTDNLLFPYITTATGSYTFLSIVTLGGGGAGIANRVHFTYATKPISAANGDSCDHLDGDATMTPNDLMQFEVQKKVDLPTLFGDVTSVPKYFPGTAVANDRHGMLVVNNWNGSVYGGSASYLNSRLYGEARIINTATGLAMGYSTDDLHTGGGTGNPNFADAAGPDAGMSAKVISWFPEPTVATSWFVMPLDNEQNMAFLGNATQTYGVYNSGTQNAANAFVVPTGVLGHFNNNEGFQSSLATTSVTCLGVVDRPTLLGAVNSPWSANGGWGVFAQTAAPVPATSTGSLIYKIESTNAAGKASFVTREPVL